MPITRSISRAIFPGSPYTLPNPRISNVTVSGEVISISGENRRAQSSKIGKLPGA
jgi:hypothetical protein